MVVGAVAVLVAALVAWLLGTAWLVGCTRRGLRRLPRQMMPTELRRAAERTGATRVECVAADLVAAFCAGVILPRIFVTEGLVARLQSDELDAVLWHERSHCERRDPLRYAAGQAAARVFFFLPIVQWWVKHQRENAEIKADQAALRTVGPRPLAGALWAVGAEPVLCGTPGFDGAMELRVAQVLGDDLPRRAPASHLWLASAAGLWLAFAPVWCLAPLLHGLV